MGVSQIFFETHLFRGCLTSPYGYRTQISHTWKPWKPFGPYPVYFCVLWVDMMAFMKFQVYFPWILTIVFFISPQPLLWILRNFGWRNYSKLSSKWLQPQSCVSITLCASIHLLWEDACAFYPEALLWFFYYKKMLFIFIRRCLCVFP